MRNRGPLFRTRFGFAVQSGNEIYNPATQDQTFHSQTITSIEREAVSKLTVFPNPASTVINVSSDTSMGTIRLINAAGETILDGIKLDGNVKIPVVNISSGMYYLQYSDGQKTEMKKILIK